MCRKRGCDVRLALDRVDRIVLAAKDQGRTMDAMKQLYEKDQVFGFIGNVGTPTAAVAVPYALERRTLSSLPTNWRRTSFVGPITQPAFASRR